MKRKQLSYCPSMIRYCSSHRGRSLKPFVPAYQSSNPQALMLSAEVVDSSDQIHPCFKRSTVSGKRPPSSHKTRQALSERRIESFYEGRVDNPSSLCPLNHSVNLSLCAFNDPAINGDNTPRLVLLYGLCDEDPLPHFEARSSCLPTSHARETRA